MVTSLFRGLSFFLAAALAQPLCGFAANASHAFSIGADDFLLDGKPFVIRCGEVHAARVPKE